jgi:hypothetical protein
MDKNRVQEVLGTLLKYDHAVDSTMLLSKAGTLATQQACHPTTASLAALTQLLNYCATHPVATVQYTASDMILHVESNASYFSESCGWSRAAGLQFLRCKPVSSPPVLATCFPAIPPLNGAIYVHCQILKEVLGSKFGLSRACCPISQWQGGFCYPQYSC